MTNPDDIDDQELVNAMRALAIAILMAHGDRDHSNHSGLSVGQVLVLRDAILCAATKLEAANAQDPSETAAWVALYQNDGPDWDSITFRAERPKDGPRWTWHRCMLRLDDLEDRVGHEEEGRGR